MLLKTPGFDALVTAAAERARTCGLAADAIRIATTLDGKVPEHVGRAALGLRERLYVELAESQDAGFDAAAESGGDVLLLTETGKLRVCPEGSRPAERDHALGVVKWSHRPDSLARAWSTAGDVQRLQFEEIARWLADQGTERVGARIDALDHALVHMAPLLMYVGEERVYSNLGRFANLPGRSLAAGAPGSLLTALRQTPVSHWPAEHAAFVVCLHALISSGSPVRAEEFNGVQLAPDQVITFLEERVRAYGQTVPDLRGEPTGERLDRLAGICARRRQELLRAGTVFYRTINGVSLHKREQIMAEPVTPAELPHPIAALLCDTAGLPPVPDAGADDVRHLVEAAVEHLSNAPAPAGFTTAYEGFLHRFFTTVADATHSDVAMGRGPKSVAVLHSAVPAAARGALATRDFYCCVAPGSSFAHRFDGDRDTLARALSAYSARMRYNTWHYLPHSMSWTEEIPGRDDWFFAPMMPDLTNWSDQHHTGHVAFGVRHALRIPLGIVLEGRYRPGLYDLRLMRTSGAEYQLADLRTAIAVGTVQAMVHQAAAERQLEIHDFDNVWYRDFHGA
ncbi:hypothetical protein N4G70_08440 [Streptomyces sp. ASQP_92]|uniref:hypothetical protein n=1 Tax=Streptomyces sp. ASQP_92 TaxID=2979116 RepID=UPI0021C164A0|nr:hypothetical protein [Streptomyces sp. ASQP_92]MCT9088895.1 hypothetical protein [Streptomyces sp. ASQP_92]